MSFFSFGKQKDQHIELICDIGSGSLAVSFVQFETSKNPAVLYTERVSFSEERSATSTGMHSAVAKEFAHALKKASERASAWKMHIDKISCFYSSPWFVAQTRIFKLKQTKPITFSDKVLEKMLRQGEKDFLNSFQENSMFDTKEISFIERRVTRVRLNGYETHDPFNKKASAIEVSVFVSALSNQILKNIEESTQQFFPHIKAEHHTFPLASFAVLRNIFHSQSSFFILDVSGEVTDVSLVHDNALLDTMSYPMGKRSLIRRVQDVGGLDYALAESALSMHLKGEFKEQNKGKIELAIESVEKDWIAHLEHCMEEVSRNIAFPNSLYLMADEDALPFFESCIRKNQFKGFILSNRDLQVTSIQNTVFDSLVEYSNGIHKDLFIALETQYIHMLGAVSSRTSNNYVVE